MATLGPACSHNSPEDAHGPAGGKRPPIMLPVAHAIVGLFQQVDDEAGWCRWDEGRASGGPEDPSLTDLLDGFE